MEKLLHKLLSRRDELPLMPAQVWDLELSRAIADLNCAGVQKAGLLVWNDDLETAHALVQEDPSAEAAFWHAILHRRQGELQNALYWYGQVGKDHVVFSQIKDLIPDWTPAAFMELLGASQSPEAKLWQKSEMLELISYCLKR